MEVDSHHEFKFVTLQTIYGYRSNLFIAGFHMTSQWSCRCTLKKRISIISFVWDANMAAISIVFCASWVVWKPRIYIKGSYKGNLNHTYQNINLLNQS